MVESAEARSDVPLERVVDQARGEADDFEWQYRLVMPDHSIEYLHAVAHATLDQDGRLEDIAAIQDVMGIGLSVSHSIIERHHGRIPGARNDGPGATFSFSIPRAPERLPGWTHVTRDS